jgi:hypothetical protein
MDGKVAGIVMLLALLALAGCLHPGGDGGENGEGPQVSPAGPGCPTGSADCGGGCINLSADDRNCGGCGHACPLGQHCEWYDCRYPNGCRENETRCGASVYSCADLNTSVFDCGACGTTCSFVLPAETCCQGVCTNLETDPTSCGACGLACPPGQVCCAGTCVDASANPCVCDPPCQAGFTCCNRQCVNLREDTRNCGTCGHSCGGAPWCRSGLCVYP